MACFCTVPALSPLSYLPPFLILAAGTTGFGLGAAATSTAQTGLGGGLFSAKKPTTFGAPAASTAPAFGFGANTSAAPTTNLFGGTAGFGLGATSQAAQPTTGLFGATAGTTGGLFNKPATTGFGFGQTITAAPALFGAGAGATTATPSLFGNTGGLGTAPTLGFGAAATAAVPAFGAAATANQTALAPLVEQLSQNARAQQHVLDLVRNMPYGQSSLFRHLSAEPTTPASSTPASTAPAAKPGVSVLSGSAAASTLAEIHKANALSVGRSPGRVGSGAVSRRPIQSMPINRRQLFTGFHEDDALVSAQSPAPGDRKGSMGGSNGGKPSVGSENRFFVRREAWKRLNIPNSVRDSTIRRSSLAASQFERQVDDEEPESRSATSTQKPLNTGSGDNTSAAPRVQFLDSPSSTPFPPRKPTSTVERQVSMRVIILFFKVNQITCSLFFS